jgi:hypothetical protein
MRLCTRPPPSRPPRFSRFWRTCWRNSRRRDGERRDPGVHLGTHPACFIRQSFCTGMSRVSYQLTVLERERFAVHPARIQIRRRQPHLARRVGSGTRAPAPTRLAAPGRSDPAQRHEPSSRKKLNHLSDEILLSAIEDLRRPATRHNPTSSPRLGSTRSPTRPKRSSPKHLMNWPPHVRIGMSVSCIATCSDLRT